MIFLLGLIRQERDWSDAIGRLVRQLVAFSARLTIRAQPRNIDFLILRSIDLDYLKDLRCTTSPSSARFSPGGVIEIRL